MIYHSISEGSTPRALAILRMVRGRGLLRPFSMRLMVVTLMPVTSARSCCEKNLLSRIAFSVAMT